LAVFDLDVDELPDDCSPDPLEVLAGLFRKLDDRFPWRLRAACRGDGARPFFDGDPYWRAVGRRICRDCPVRRECLAFALRYDGFDDVAGIFAETNARERRRLVCLPRKSASDGRERRLRRARNASAVRQRPFSALRVRAHLRHAVGRDTDVTREVGLRRSTADNIDSRSPLSRIVSSANDQRHNVPRACFSRTGRRTPAYRHSHKSDE
jgi:hypothetical protein